MIRTEERIINGGTYSVTQIAGSQGLRTYKRLLKALLPALGASADAAEGRGRFSDLGRIIGEVVGGPEGEALQQELLVSVRYNGQPLDPDTHWPEHYEDFHELMAFAVQVNYAKVFRAAAGKMTGLSERLLQVVSDLQGRLSTLNPKSPGSSPEASSESPISASSP